LISQEVWFTIYSTLGAFYLPLTIMLCMYWKIYVEASKFESQGRKQSTGSYSQVKLCSFTYHLYLPLCKNLYCSLF